MKSNTKIAILVLSIFSLLAVRVLLKGQDVAFAIGGMIFEIAIGALFVGIVLLNLLLFFINLIKPNNKLKFDMWDKIIAGIWVMIILKVFNII